MFRDILQKILSGGIGGMSGGAMGNLFSRAVGKGEDERNWEERLQKLLSGPLYGMAGDLGDKINRLF